MHALITNDDGYHAPGLRALVETVKALGLAATVVAPSAPMSGASQARRSGVHAPWAWAEPIAGVPAIRLESTPAACVVFALTSGVVPPIDLCLSGINAGENLGAALSVSGTYGAVREAAARGVPGIALSREFGGPWTESENWDWTWVPGAAVRTVTPLLAAPSRWHSVNINLSGTDRGADPARTTVSRVLYYEDTYDVSSARIVSVIGYRAAELSPGDDIHVFAEQKRSSVTVFPRACPDKFI